MDCIRDLIFVVDEAGLIRRCNRAVSDLFALDFKEIIGRDLVELCASNGLSLPTDFEVHEVQKHPGDAWFSFKQHHLGSRGPSSLEASFNKVVTFHDITLVKAISAELESEHAKVQERNARLEETLAELKNAQARILQQENMASIGQLAAGVAHEINNPMGFISGNLGALGKYLERLVEFIVLQENTIGNQEMAAQVAQARKKLKIDFVIQDTRDLISESLEGADRVSRIIQNLKMFSHVDERQERQTANLNECLESTVNILRNSLNDQSTIRTEYGTLPPIQCFPHQLNQVFMNLIVNAAHAIDRQGEISIRSWAENGTVKIAVSDTGCGIPADQLTKIFEPFFTTKPVGHGTGLGLSVCYEIIKGHGGEIVVESHEGKGTTFTVVLPTGDQHII